MSIYSSFRTLSDKEIVRAALNEPLTDDEFTLFCIISCKWFSKWMDYVDFSNKGTDHRTQEEIEELYPGLIDNSDILLEDDKLKRGLTEGVDYRVISEKGWKTLFAKYKGGPYIAREVINLGTISLPVYQVELYTLPFLAYFSTRAQPGLDGQVPISWSVSKSCSLGQVCGDIIRGRARQHQYSSYRCWFRPMPADVASTSEQATSTTAVVPSTNKRRLTSDVTDMHDGWRLFRSPKSVRSMDICTDDGTQYELIIEISSSLAMSVDQYSDHDWPRGLQAAAWRTDLRVGDEVDVEDLDCNWVEGVVVECDASHTVVHLRGWETSDDIDIAARMVPCKVMPLYSHSKNWREKLEEDDEVEILVVDESSGLKAWKIGTVVELNVPGRTVLVKQSDEAESVAASSSDPADDDRPIYLGGEPPVATETETTSAVPKVKEPASTSWHYLDEETICQAYTHVAKPKGYGARRYSDTYDWDDYGEKSVLGKPTARGAVGLKNLGNTCFMNSILQCLSNTFALTDFFISNRYKSQINVDNALGRGGKVALAYAKMLKEMWCDGYSKVVPRNFKKVIGEFQPQFAGYSQQDSQEFMGFLLDGLHEDLNRVARPPYVPKIESCGRPDSLISSESWRRFLLRNDSELVDRVYGQLRSHVTCVSCGKESVTFDAFNTLSLPVPLKIKTSEEVEIIVHVLPPGSVPLRLTVDMESTDKIKDLKKKAIDALFAAGHLTGYSKTEAPVSGRSSDIASGYVSINSNGDSDTETEEMSFKRLATGSSALVQYSEEAYIARQQALAAGAALYPVFHVATQNSYDKGKISNSWDDHERLKLSSYSKDTVFMFQLEHPCLPRETDTCYELFDGGKYVDYIDIYFGSTRVSTYGTSTLVAQGLPRRISITRVISARDIYAWADASVKRWFHADSKFSGGDLRGFSVVMTTSYSDTAKLTLSATDTQPLRLTKYDVLMVVFSQEAFSHLHLKVSELDRRLDIAEDADDSDSEGMANGKAGLNIYKCIDKFIEREHLNEAETLYCSSCKQHLAPVKKMDLWATPDILVLHLKRFQMGSGAYATREKISDFIDFPINGLNLSSYVKGPQYPAAPPVYDLYGVSLHSGGLGGGHYTAVCRNPTNDKWYNFNDEYVSEATPASAVSEMSYVLFYKRRTGALKWAGIVPLAEGLPDEA